MARKTLGVPNGRRGVDVSGRRREHGFFGSNDSFVYAVDIDTGEEKWKFQTRGRVRSSPAVSDGIVFIGSNDGFLYALDAETGEKRWILTTWEVESSPAIDAGVIYFGNNEGTLYALDIDSGEKKW